MQEIEGRKWCSMPAIVGGAKQHIGTINRTDRNGSGEIAVVGLGMVGWVDVKSGKGTILILHDWLVGWKTGRVGYRYWHESSLYFHLLSFASFCEVSSFVSWLQFGRYSSSFLGDVPLLGRDEKVFDLSLAWSLSASSLFPSSLFCYSTLVACLMRCTLSLFTCILFRRLARRQGLTRDRQTNGKGV